LARLIRGPEFEEDRAAAICEVVHGRPEITVVTPAAVSSNSVEKKEGTFSSRSRSNSGTRPLTVGRSKCRATRSRNGVGSKAKSQSLRLTDGPRTDIAINRIVESSRRHQVIDLS
jgi:hypothetical protein